MLSYGPFLLYGDFSLNMAYFSSWARWRGCWTFLFARSQMCAWDSYDNGAFPRLWCSRYRYTRVSLIYGMHLFSGKCIWGIHDICSIDTPIYEKAVAQAEGIILVLMSWAVWFACVGIKLYKRHLCQKDGQHLRKLLRIRQCYCESDYYVSCHLC